MLMTQDALGNRGNGAPSGLNSGAASTQVVAGCKLWLTRKLWLIRNLVWLIRNLVWLIRKMSLTRKLWLTRKPAQVAV